MKFDLVLSNPPYTRNIDHNILREVLPLTEKATIIHPGGWLMTRKKNKFRDDFGKHLESVDLFNGNPLFNIGLFVPIAISNFDMTNTYEKTKVGHFGEEFTVHYSNITQFGKSWENLVKPFYKEMTKRMKDYENIQEVNVCKNLEEYKFYIQLAVFRGHVASNKTELLEDDFFTLLQKDPEKNLGIRSKEPYFVLGFQTEEEQRNCLEYLKTDFVRFCLALNKSAQGIYGNVTLIPWLDFTQSWDDEKLYKKFNVSKELQEYIREFLPDYYNLRGEK